MDTVVFPTAQAAEYFTEKMVLAKIDAEVDTVLAKRYFVSGYPTLVLVRSDGTEIDRIVGYLDIDEFLQTLNDYQVGIGTLDDLLAKMKTTPDREIALEVANKYKFSGRPSEASRWFSRVIEMGQPRDSMSGEARSAEANMYYRAKEYPRALAAFSGIEKDFSGTMFARDALIWQGLIHTRLEQKESAIQSFEHYLKMYPDSEDVDYVTEKLAALRESEN